MSAVAIERDADDSAISSQVDGDFFGDFFAPTSTDLVTGLVASYRQDRARITAAAAFINGPECTSVLNYFLEGNSDPDRGRASLSHSANQLFQEGGAVASLNAHYWSKALSLTDVYDAMPQDRRNQWNEQMRNPKGVKKDFAEVRRDKDVRPEIFDRRGEYLNPADAYRVGPLPDFVEETVRSTLLDLINSRAKFLAERVDGIFRALSGEHVTNRPEGFGKRMIIAHLISSYGTTNHDRVGYINDLRCVIAKFMGRDEPSWNATSRVVDMARRYRRGEWVTLDGGALRLRAYNCGTAHMEVHPDMAWRLNCVLAHLYPLAIPSKFRQRPKKQPKDFVMMGRPLPFSVIEALDGLEPAYRVEKCDDPRAWNSNTVRTPIPNGLQLRYGRVDDKVLQAEIDRVMAYLGGVKTELNRASHYYAFDYNARDVIAEVVASGCLPDQKAHQFYPTPPHLAEIAVGLADIGCTDRCLEPSAGVGNIADLMPRGRTYCVEISKLHCEVLRAKGYQVFDGDFLQFINGRYDRIVMNPPFSEGRWQAHVEHAATQLDVKGKLVAILPASAKGKFNLPGFELSWHGPHDNEFAGTSISVVILVAEIATP